MNSSDRVDENGGLSAPPFAAFEVSVEQQIVHSGALGKLNDMLAAELLGDEESVVLAVSGIPYAVCGRLYELLGVVMGKVIAHGSVGEIEKMLAEKGDIKLAD